MKEKLAALLLQGSDIEAYRAALLEFHANISSGTFFPIWSQHAWLGYGAPDLGFLPPLQLYSTEIFYAITKDPLIAMTAAVATALLVGAAGSYRLLRTRFSKPESALGALLYFFCPYLLTGVFISGVLHFSFCFSTLPWIIYFAIQAAKKPNSSELLGLSLSCAALAATHARFFIFILPFAVLSAFLQRKHILRMRIFAAAALLGFCSSGFYLVETLIEKTAFSRTQSSAPEHSTDATAEFVKGRGDVLCSRPSPTRIDCEIMAIQHSLLRFNVMDYPGWTVSRSKENLLKKPDADGRIQVELPPGKQRITAQLLNTPLRALAKIISIVAFIGCFLFSFRNALLSKNHMPE